jgi:hypothetical protein
LFSCGRQDGGGRAIFNRAAAARARCHLPAGDSFGLNDRAGSRQYGDRGGATMADTHDFIATLLAPKGMLFWLATLVAGVVASGVFLANTAHRNPVNAALASKGLAVPEAVWSYDKVYLDAVIKAMSPKPTEGGKSLLERYVRPTLIWNDVVFAVALALFTALVAVGIAPYLRWKPWSGYLMLFFAAMGLLYGIADLAEDWKLKTILDPAAPVNADDANVAKWLTRAKLVSITLSGIGAATFELLQLVAKLLR